MKFVARIHRLAVGQALALIAFGIRAKVAYETSFVGVFNRNIELFHGFGVYLILLYKSRGVAMGVEVERVTIY